MKDLIGEGGGVNRQDLSKRMADNVVEALGNWLREPSPRGMDQVYIQSCALQSLATLAIAEQLQALAVALEPDELTGEEDAQRIMEMWP